MSGASAARRAPARQCEVRSTAPATARPAQRIRLWDLPTRVFHWSLVLAVTAAIISGELGGDWMAWHGRAGLAIVGLVTFRLVWGFVGSTYARFRQFAPSPAALRAYLRGRWQGQGHNPLGALSVFALLALLATQAVTGLFGNDEIAFSGPLAALIEESLSNRLTALHKQLAYVLFGLMALHILAIVVYLRLKKDNLVKPMLTGWKELRSTAPGAVSASASGPVALVLALAAAAVAVYCAAGGTLLH